MFLKICLIPSRIDQKFSFKGRNTLVLKREIGPKSWAIEAVVGAVFQGRGSDSLGRIRSSHIGREFRFEFAPNSHHFSHDRATIVVLAVRRSPSPRRRGDSTTFALRSRLDRAAIAVRSDRDRGVLPRSVWTVRLIFR